METQKKLSNLTSDQLGAVLTALIEEIADVKFLIKHKNAAEPPKRRPIGVYEASKIIKKEIRTIYNLTSSKKIPHYKRGHQLYFFEDELLDYIESGKQIQ